MTTVHQGSFIEFQCYIDTNNAKYFTQLDGFISSLGMNYIFPQISFLGTKVFSNTMNWTVKCVTSSINNIAKYNIDI